MQREFTYQVYLQLSIVFLVLLVRTVSVFPPGFETAILTCTSLPVAYALTLVHYAGVRRFVRRRNHAYIDVLQFWVYEFAAILLAFMVGYIMFVATTGMTDLMLFLYAFLAALSLRVLTVAAVEYLYANGVDPGHPAVAFAVSFMLAAVVFSVLAALV